MLLNSPIHLELQKNVCGMPFVNSPSRHPIGPIPQWKVTHAKVCEQWTLNDSTTNIFQSIPTPVFSLATTISHYCSKQNFRFFSFPPILPSILATTWRGHRWSQPPLPTRPKMVVVNIITDTIRTGTINFSKMQVQEEWLHKCASCSWKGQNRTFRGWMSGMHFRQCREQGSPAAGNIGAAVAWRLRVETWDSSRSTSST